jgi:uncharacterized protein YndB with AHSA1/START domain
MKIELPISLRINKSRDEVFRAFTDRALCRNFLCDAMSGEWKSGCEVNWVFGTFRTRIKVDEAIPNELLRFRWPALFTETETEVRIQFLNQEPGVSGVKLFETGWESDQDSLKSALDHACAWKNMLCRLKAWLEYGVDLRK